MSNVVIARPIGGITINNELEFLLDDSGSIRVFGSTEQARSFLADAGVGSEELRHMTFMESYRTCCRCGSLLFRSLLPNYSFQCFICDEDFYNFEQTI